ncbi:MAG: hypothetical protein J6T51_01015, partial [Kiritimatiellae bacterium]|nr:hypothetical protein [Kiritimatiellia bacterium]
ACPQTASPHPANTPPRQNENLVRKNLAAPYGISTVTLKKRCSEFAGYCHSPRSTTEKQGRTFSNYWKMDRILAVAICECEGTPV